MMVFLISFEIALNFLLIMTKSWVGIWKSTFFFNYWFQLDYKSFTFLSTDALEKLFSIFLCVNFLFRSSIQIIFRFFKLIGLISICNHYWSVGDVTCTVSSGFFSPLHFSKYFSSFKFAHSWHGRKGRK